MFYRMNWHAATRRVLIESNANSAPGAIGGEGMTNLGMFEHDSVEDDDAGLPGMQNLPDNHVIFHHVQEALYKEGVQDTQSIKILIDSPRSIAITGDDLEVVIGEDSEPLAITTTPATARETDVNFTSSNETIATVDREGVVRGVSEGTATITATLRTDSTVSTEIEVTVVTEATTPPVDEGEEETDPE